MWSKGNYSVLLMGLEIGTPMKNSMEVPHKIKSRTNIWSEILLLGIYPKEMKTGVIRGRYTPMFLQHYLQN